MEYTDIMNVPHSLEAEQSVLGSILLEPTSIAQVLEYVTPDSFYRQQHKDIFSVLLRMFSSGRPIDIITVVNEAQAENIFDTPSAAKTYLAQLMELVPTTANLEDYCKIVQEKHYMRNLLTTAKGIIEDINSGNSDARSLLDAAEQRIYDIRQGKAASGMTRIDEVIVQTYDRLQKLSGEDGEQYAGIPTGYKRLDTLLTGLNKSDLILIAARPAMGKTSFALNIASEVAKNTKKEVAIFSLEMSKEQLVNRMLSAESLVSSYSLRTGNLQPDEWTALASGAGILAGAPIYLDDTPGITVAQMKAKLRRLRNLGLVVIDYLQLMSSGRRSDNRVLEISEITRNLKAMAKELDVPVISLSQLSRGPDSRTDHRPMLSDLRESGSIEQDADIVMFLYRDAYYNKETEEQNVAECIVAKNRHGEADTVKLAWDGEHTRFLNLETYREG